MAKRDCVLTGDIFDAATLQLEQAAALATWAYTRADKADVEIVTALTLLQERIEKVGVLLERAWDASQARQRAK